MKKLSVFAGSRVLFAQLSEERGNVKPRGKIAARPGRTRQFFVVEECRENFVVEDLPCPPAAVSRRIGKIQSSWRLASKVGLCRIPKTKLEKISTFFSLKPVGPCAINAKRICCPIAASRAETLFLDSVTALRTMFFPCGRQEIGLTIFDANDTT